MRLRLDRSASALLAAMLMAAPAFGSPGQENQENIEQENIGQENMVQVYFEGEVPGELAEGANISADGSVMLSLGALRDYVGRFVIQPTLAFCSLDPSIEQIQASLGFSIGVVGGNITLVLRCPGRP